MTTWTAEELDAIARADELQIAPQQADGHLRTPTPIWVVRDGDDLYVRAYRGRNGVWFAAAQASHQGRIQAAGIGKDVAFIEEADPATNDRIDAAYRTKYGRYSATYIDPMVAAPARATTLQLLPR